MIVPLRARGDDIGALAVFDRLDADHPLGPDDLAALESFGTSVATRIAAARALEDERLSLSISYSERERKRWARELHDETLQELGALNVMQESALQVDDADIGAPRTGEIERAGRADHLRPAGLDHRASPGGAGPAGRRGRGRGPGGSAQVAQ